MTDGLTELEERLATPGGTVVRDQLLRRLDALQQRLDTALARGVQPTEFQRGQATSHACEAAREALQRHPCAEPNEPHATAR